MGWVGCVGMLLVNWQFILARIIHELASISRRDLFSQGISFLSRILIDICEKKKFPVESKIK